MPNCGKCGEYFKFHIKIDNKWRNMTGRRFCLKCSPFGTRNKRDLTRKPACELNKQEFTQNITDVNKSCGKCHKLLPTTSFYIIKRGKNKAYRLTSYCKECSKIILQKRNHNNKMEAVKYKGGKCEDCGFQGCINVFEFHHLDPKQKDFDIAQYRSKKLNDRIKKELDKCAILCANCHRTRHAKLTSL